MSRKHHGSCLGAVFSIFFGLAITGSVAKTLFRNHPWIIFVIIGGIIAIIVLLVIGRSKNRKEYESYSSSAPAPEHREASRREFRPYSASATNQASDVTPMNPVHYEASRKGIETTSKLISKMSRQSARCESCGATLHFNINAPKIICDYCGSPIPDFKKIVEYQKYVDREVEYSDTVRKNIEMQQRAKEIELEKSKIEAKKDTRELMMVVIIVMVLVIPIILFAIYSLKLFH